MSSATPSIDMALLQRLHTLLQTRVDLASQQSRCPIRRKSSQKKLDQANEKLEQERSELKKLQLQADDKQLQLAEREQRVADREVKLKSAASNREYQTLKDEIAADRQANEVLSDEILELFEEIDQHQKLVVQADEELAVENTAHEDRIKVIEQREEEIRKDLDRIESELKASESDMPSHMKGDYQRLVEAKADDALAAIDEDSCGVCRQILTTQWIDRLRMSKLVRCPGCDAFLYIPQSRRV